MWRDIRTSTVMVRAQRRTEARKARGRVAIQILSSFNPKSILVEAGRNGSAFRTVPTRSAHSRVVRKSLQRSDIRNRVRCESVHTARHSDPGGPSFPEDR